MVALSASGAVPMTNAATSIWSSDSPVRKLYFDPAFRPENRYANDPTLGVDKLDLKGVPSPYDVMQEYRDRKKIATQCLSTAGLQTGANEPRLEPFARQNPANYYWMRAMKEFPFFLGCVSTTTPESAQTESGVSAAPTRAVPNSRRSGSGSGGARSASPRAAPESPSTKRMKILTEYSMLKETLKGCAAGDKAHTLFSAQADQCLADFKAVSAQAEGTIELPASAVQPA